VCKGNTQESDDVNKYIIIKVLFFDYNEEAIHFLITDGNDTWDDWRAALKMKVISNEYENLIFRIIIGEYPVREQLKGSSINIIKINKNYLEEYLYHNGNYPIYSSSIMFF
jgi:hypothetical protein